MQQKLSYKPDANENSEALKNKFTTISFDEALELCQKYITKIATNAFRRENDPARKREMTRSYIYEFVDSQNLK